MGIACCFEVLIRLPSSPFLRFFLKFIKSFRCQFVDLKIVFNRLIDVPREKFD